MKERQLVEGDMVYIDNTNNVYELSSVTIISGKVFTATVYCKDSPTGHKSVEHPELVRRVPSQYIIDDTKNQ